MEESIYLKMRMGNEGYVWTCSFWEDQWTENVDLVQSYWIAVALHISYRTFGAPEFFDSLLVRQTTSAKDEGPLRMEKLKILSRNVCINCVEGLRKEFQFCKADQQTSIDAFQRRSSKRMMPWLVWCTKSTDV